MKPIAEPIRQLIAKAIVDQPEKTYDELAQQFGVHKFTVCKIAVKFGIRRPVGNASLPRQARYAARLKDLI